MRTERTLRLVLGGFGVALIGYGVLRILQNPTHSHPRELAVWLAGALVLHDALIAPAVIGTGWLLARTLPSRARSFVQGGLVVAAMVSVVGIFLVERQGKTASPALALLNQDYVVNLLILYALIAGVTCACYLVAVLRTRRRKVRSSADH